MRILTEILDCVKILDITAQPGGYACVNGADRGRGRQPKARTAAKTRLQQWLDDHEFTSAQLEAETGIARQSMTKIRRGQDVRMKTMLRILKAARRMKGPEVQITDLFDLDPARLDDPV